VGWAISGKEPIMKRLLCVAAALIVIAAGNSDLYAGTIETGFEEYLKTLDPGKVVRAIVKLRDQVDTAQIIRDLEKENALLTERHLRVITALREVAERSQPSLLQFLATEKALGRVTSYRAFWIANLVVVESKVLFLPQLAARPEVEIIYEDAPIELIAPVAETAGAEPPRGVEAGITASRAPELWSMGITGAGTLVSHLDTGVDGDHPALAARWHGLDPGVDPSAAWYDPVTHTSYPFDSGSHGTHTMGTICGRDGDTVVGMAWEAKWISAGVIDRVSISQPLSDAIAAFEWTADPDGDPGTMSDVPDVSSNSWGLSPFYHGVSKCEDPGLWSVIDNVEAAGCVVVFAAGNEGSGGESLRVPADRDTTPVNCFSVGALNQDATTIASFSSRGPSGCPTASLKPEVSAVGNDVNSCYPGGGYGTMSGTSMACPHVAGAVALLRQVNPNATPEDVKYALLYSAVDLGTAGEDNTFGMGLIDVVAAAELVGLGSLATLEGTVTDAVTGDPLVARIAVAGSADLQVYSKADGSYLVKVQPGDYTMEVWVFGYLPQTISFTAGESETLINDFTLALAPRGTLQGIVINSKTGLPEPSVAISLAGTPQPPAYTGQAGGYYDDTIPAGMACTVEASKHDFFTTRVEEVFIEPEAVTTLNMYIGPIPYGDVEVQVLNGVRCEVRVYNGLYTYGDEYTDSTGYILFEDVVAEQSYTVKADKLFPFWEAGYVYEVWVPEGELVHVDVEMGWGVCVYKAASDLMDMEREIPTLQAFRDDVLERSQFGRLCIDLYQKHVLEVSRLIFTDSRLRALFVEGTRAIMPEVRRLLTATRYGVAPAGGTVMPEEKMALLREILDAFEGSGSASLRQDIRNMCRKLDRIEGKDLGDFILR